MENRTAIPQFEVKKEAGRQSTIKHCKPPNSKLNSAVQIIISDLAHAVLHKRRPRAPPPLPGKPHGALAMADTGLSRPGALQHPPHLTLTTPISSLER